MDSLEINGKMHDIKFNYKFYDRVVQHFADDQDTDKNTKVDGFNLMIGQLIDKNPQAVVKAYRYACVGKSLPALSDVADALDKEGIWDSKDPYADLYKQIKAVGFLAQAINHFLTSTEQDYEISKIGLSVAKKFVKKDEDGKEVTDQVRALELEAESNKAQAEWLKKRLEALGK